MSLKTVLTGIADKIRQHAEFNHTPLSGKLKLEDMADAIDRVCTDGYNQGFYKADVMISDLLRNTAEGLQEYLSESSIPNGNFSVLISYIEECIPYIYENGQKSEYDRFWDAYQENGERKDYSYCFSGIAWTTETFKPKWDIRPVSAVHMFWQATNLTGSLPERLNRLGIELDFSMCTSFNSMLQYSKISEMGVIDTRSADTINYIFRYATSLETVQKLILRDDGSQTFGTYTFDRASVLKNIAVEGTIGDNCDIHFSPLTKASITSIVNALKSTANEKVLTLSKNAVINAFGSAEAADWLSLINTKSSWKISLI